MTRREGPFLFVLGLVLLTLSLTARAHDDIVIQLKWLHQFQFAGYYAAVEQGFFAEEGLDVTLRERDTGHDTINEVLSGAANYGLSDSVVMLQQARGQPLVIVAPILQHSPNVVLTLATSGLDKPRDLIGKRLAFDDDDSDGIGILAMLASQGILDEGIERRSFDARVAELIAGEVDAISAYSNNKPFMFRQLGHDVNLIHPRHYGFDLYGDMLFTSRAEADHHPDRVAAVQRAVLRGWEYALDNKKEMVELIYQQYNSQQKTREALMHEAEGIEHLIARHTIKLGSLDQGRVDHLLSRLRGLDLIPQGEISGAGLQFRAGKPKGFTLTSEERMFLEQLGPVRFGAIEEGWPPFEFLHEGQFKGIASDYLAALEDMLDIEFERVTQQDWEETLDYAKARSIDVLPVAASTPSRREYMRFTTPYVRSPMVLVTRDDVEFIPSLAQLEGQSVGVVGGHASDEMLARHHPAIQRESFHSANLGLRALASGDIYAFIDNLAAVSHIIKDEGLTNLKISGQTPYDFNLSLGIRNDWPLLHSAVEKALTSMTPQAHNEIYDRWVRLEMAQPFPWRQMLIPAVLLAALFIMLLSYLWHLRKFNRRMQRTNKRLAEVELALREKNRQLHELSITDKLTGVFNRHRLDSVLAEQFEQAQRYRRPLALVLFDLDHFKQINDRFGHQAGDDVIRRFTRTVTDNTRQSDIFGRWGGEEFLLICPENTTEQACLVAEKVRTAFSAQQPEDGTQTTVSAGVIDNSDAKTVDQLVSGADRQLYAAKLAGRNRVFSGK